MPFSFPLLEFADEDGFLCYGDSLTPELVIAAYHRGIFPWPFINEGEEILAWFSPDPRAIIEFENFHTSRRLARRIRSGVYTVTFDQDFTGVIAGCADRSAKEGVWLTDTIQKVYTELYHQGVAHSVEVWHNNQLVGGLYGLKFGKYYSAESMFYRERDASKVALAALVNRLQSEEFQLLDIQQLNDHTISLGATEIARDLFIERLNSATKSQ